MQQVLLKIIVFLFQSFLVSFSSLFFIDWVLVKAGCHFNFQNWFSMFMKNRASYERRLLMRFVYANKPLLGGCHSK